MSIWNIEFINFKGIEILCECGFKFMSDGYRDFSEDNKTVDKVSSKCPICDATYDLTVCRT